MRNAIYILLAFLPLLTSCEREDPEPDQPKYEIPLNKSIVKDVTPNSVTFQYKVSAVEVSETGVYVLKDSTALNPVHISENLNAAEYNAQHDLYSVTVTGLEPYTSYWYIVKVVDRDGNVSFTKATSFKTDGFNLTWREGFSRKIKLKGPSYESLHLTAEYADTDLSHYTINYKGTELTLLRVMKIEASANQYDFTIQIPADVSIGAGTFSVHYKNRKIFEDVLVVEQGDIYEAVKVAKYEHAHGDHAFFEYNDRVHIIYLNGRYRHDIWNPKTNQWEEKPVPDEVTLQRNMEGLEINGKIYFTALSKRGFYESQTYIGCQERIYAYDPKDDSWEFYPLYTSSNSSESLNPYGSFVYQNKLYCFGQRVRYVDGVSQEKQLLQVFNPADKSWEVVMELHGTAWGYKGIVIDGRIYIVAAEEKEHYSATVEFKHELSELNLVSKTLVKKAPLVFNDDEKGSLEPNLFEYRGHLFVFGGKSSVGYYGAGITDLYEYAPESDSWTQLHALDTQLPCQSGFCYVIDNSIYMGLGLNSSLYRSNDIYELKLSN
ncbi:hypothetical protein DXT99_25890 [Pontibacter diazotrophicus]|uniref:Fibronectin type-III domain-containing protein n=1 Tax=Pontibacter diazotrophicus TaxID=1400979 RepID=A0A3D8L160_9BACT|nr:fibronectin type III domain-containing protein [Pontibacter diazotrophicus]RDV10742.1 hypothetical protein DXT99_25890 [Pontibacter diazotrophicus]